MKRISGLLLLKVLAFEHKHNHLKTHAGKIGVLNQSAIIEVFLLVSHLIILNEF